MCLLRNFKTSGQRKVHEHNPANQIPVHAGHYCNILHYFTVSAPSLRPESFSHVSDLARLVPSYFICRTERIEVISQELLG